MDFAYKGKWYKYNDMPWCNLFHHCWWYEVIIAVTCDIFRICSASAVGVLTFIDNKQKLGQHL